tara:strand:- start:3800 stop:4192 length:393 start_codon:yes stop_codon:yes gene_type:complete
MFSVLTSKLFGGLALALAALLVFQAVKHGWEIDSKNDTIETLRNDVKALNSTIATLQNNNVALEQGINACNASVENAAALANSVARSGQAAVDAATRTRQSVEKQVATIGKMRAESCEDVYDILVQGAGQ